MSAQAHIDLQLLEPLLRGWVAAIGLDNTLRLVERFGGVRIYVPRNPTSTHQLADIIGFEALQTLARMHGAEEHFRVPKAQVALRELRDRAIRAARATSSVRDLALAHRITERRVQQICGEVADASDPNQASMF